MLFKQHLIIYSKQNIFYLVDADLDLFRLDALKNSFNDLFFKILCNCFEAIDRFDDYLDCNFVKIRV